MSFEEIERDLIEWGLIERGETLALSKRFRGALMRAAAALQEEEKRGERREGNAVANAIGLALDAFPLPSGSVVTPTHRAFLVAVEIESLPPAVRQMLGV